MTFEQDGALAKAESRYQGFRLESVSWGYREIFEKSIKRLFTSGVIGRDTPEVTAKFFEMMRGTEQMGFDRVLKDFLAAIIDPRARWITRAPEVFADVVDTSRLLAETKHYYASAFFETLGRGGFGNTPAQVRELMTLVRRVRRTSDQLAVALIRGYARLLERLSPAGINQYVKWGLEIHSRNVPTGLRFMEGLLRSSEDYIRHIGRVCLLSKIRPSLERLLRALVGYGVQVGDLGELDSDALIEHGSRTVCLYRRLYLPASCSHFGNAACNRSWYTLAGVCAAGMLAAGSFPAIHGHRDYRTCADVVGPDRENMNLLTILEYARVLEYVRTSWPGATSLLTRGLTAESDVCPPVTTADRLLFDVARKGEKQSPAHAAICRAARRCRNVFEAAKLVNGGWGDQVRVKCPGLGSTPLRIISFLPDFRYPGATESPPPDSLILDLKQDTHREHPRDEVKRGDRKQRDQGVDEVKRGDRKQRDQGVADHSISGKALEKDVADGGEVRACYVYDEWSHPDRDYYRDYCLVHESQPNSGPCELPPGFSLEANRIRKAFEFLKPDAPVREKRLPEGEVINHERLLDFVVQRRREPSPQADFYERPRISRRDVATLILLDVSGSTGVLAPGEGKVIDLEKRAAITLARALASLGDRFAVCGFSGQGREHCRYWVYKDFAERWGEASLNRVLAARPATGTRIGAALRHSGYRLSKIDARRKLVLLVTDGNPLDAGYDPNTRYAQYDVRRACQENRQRGVNVLCISTDEDNRADMEIMFPRKRFTVLQNIGELPQRLAAMYIRATK